MLTRIEARNADALAAFVAQRNQEIPTKIIVRVSEIIDEVRKNKDAACRQYTEAFDKVKLDSFEVSDKEWEQAISLCGEDFKKAMAAAKENILFYHKAQVSEGYTLKKEMDIVLGQRVLPLEKIGIYVPGGRAQYPSSVLMNAIPAHVAGVQEIIMVTPPDSKGTIHPNIAYAAKLAGVTRIFKIGGAQAVAALAYGTETIPAVDKIVGPGNIYVAAAKKLVFGKVDIDMIAGPSEILVIADENADPGYVAADLLSQAEHDPMASAILMTTSEKVAEEVNEQLRKQSAVLPKKAIVEESLKNYGRVLVLDSLEDCVRMANLAAPEHLELMVENPWELLPMVKNAGSVFVGYYTCESVGDYFGGTNHVLPTSGTARFSSALGVDAFVKKSCFLSYSKEALQAYGDSIITMAREEDLEAHARAVVVRKESLDEGNC